MVATRIVKEHGGTLSLRSSEGEGTTVEITLPREAPVPG
jgi:signal transduction histidine kinase